MINTKEFDHYKTAIFIGVNQATRTEILLKQIKEFQAMLVDNEETIARNPETDEAFGGVLICLDELICNMSQDLKLIKEDVNSNYRALQRKIFDAE